MLLRLRLEDRADLLQFVAGQCPIRRPGVAQNVLDLGRPRDYLADGRFDQQPGLGQVVQPALPFLGPGGQFLEVD